ncbi:MAG: ABC transporter permease [Spirochaetaceae bacterium]
MSDKSYIDSGLEASRPDHPNVPAPDDIKQTVSEKSESLWHIYLRRFRKHNLGKVGLVVLAVLYVVALFADFLSPYTMTWTNKRKSYHPPTKVTWLYEGEDGREFRPFTYERLMTNVARKEYGIIPPRSIRVVTIPASHRILQMREVSISRDPAERKETIIDAVAAHYTIPPDSGVLQTLSERIDELERSEDPDARMVVQVGTRDVRGEEQPERVILAKGNKNFIRFFGKGVPYRFLGLFEARRHLVTSETGGYFPLGNDRLGRDIMSRLMHGSQVSLTVGLLGAMITFVFGLAIGGIAGYAGGAVDNVLMRLSEVIIAIPGLYLLFALRSAFPSNLSSIQVYLLIVVILSTIGWATVARVIRGMVLSLKSEDFVLSARTMGLSHWRIIRKHILPNTLSYVIVQSTIMIPQYILGESALSLLGLGITEPQSSWGLMLSVARNHRVVRDFPWILVPGFAIFIAILAWNFFGDGVRDSVDPKSKH